MALCFCIVAISASTLQKLTLEQMTEKSTDVVLAKVSQCAPEKKGKLVFTTCSLDVAERWKTSSDHHASKVSLPGGSFQGTHQQFSGVPVIKPDTHYVFFLWTGPSGMTQIIGLSQGAIAIEKSREGVSLAVRTPTRSRLLSTHGKAVWDEGVDLQLEELRRIVRKVVSR